MRMKYTVLYVEDCEPKLMKFPCLRTAKHFIKSFLNYAKTVGNTDDNWIDMLIRDGNPLISEDSCYDDDQK